MARWAWIAIAVLGCSSRAGLAIDVDLGGAASAELLAPVKPCDDCDQGIAPPGAQSPLVGRNGSGVVTYLDSTTRLLAKADAHGHAHFELEAGRTDPIPKLVIVGFDANDQATGSYLELTDVTVPHDGGVVWNVKLQPAPAGKQLLAWRQPDAPCGSSPTHASCVGIQSTDDGSTSFYVPDDDPDCDGCTGSADCDDYWYLDKEAGVPCFTRRPTGSGTASSCEGGIGSCIDGAGPSQMSCLAIPETICVPDAVCGTGSCFQGITGCLAPSPVPSSYVMLSCTLVVSEADAGGGEVDATPCLGQQGLSPVALQLPGCLDGGFPGAITALGMIATGPTAAFTSPDLDSQRSTAMMTMDATATPGCTLDFGWSGDLVFQGSMAPPSLDDLYVVVTLTGTTQLVLPMTVSLDNGNCTPGGAPIHCEAIAPADTVYDCAM